MKNRLAIFSFFVAIVVVVLGAYTRLADAGLGCPDWPTCYGHLWVPNSLNEIQKANEIFSDTPVETDKTWPEQIHRIFASSLGILLLVMFVLAVRSMPSWQKDRDSLSIIAILAALVIATAIRVKVGEVMEPVLAVIVAAYFANLVRLRYTPFGASPAFKHIAVLNGLVILQGLFGMWTVTLKLWPQVVTAHLLGGFATLSLIWLLIQRLYNLTWQVSQNYQATLTAIRPLALVVLGLVIVQISLGGWTSSNYAALACPDFPLCQNSLWPNADFASGFNFFQHIGPNYLGGIMNNDARIAIHLVHRIGAIFVAIGVGLLIFRLASSGVKKAKVISLVLAAALTLQLLLGVMNIVLSLPLSIAVAHNAVGALLLLTIVTVNHRLFTVRSE